VDPTSLTVFAVDAVASRGEAIEQLRFGKYAVAVIDWQMPRVSA
jgi:CheY-like chemotaxis protein